MVYRAAALRQVGGFDESLGYGYDNDLSYRLRAAGYRLRYVPAAQSTHRWRDGLAGYVRQHMGSATAGSTLAAKHRGRLTGDSGSPAMMMAHPATFQAVALGLLASAGVLPAFAPASLIRRLEHRCSWHLPLNGVGLGARAARRFGDSGAAVVSGRAPRARPCLEVAAIAVWLVRRVAGAHPPAAQHATAACRR